MAVEWVQKGLWWIAVDDEKKHVVHILKKTAPDLNTALSIYTESLPLIDSGALRFGEQTPKQFEISGKIRNFLIGYNGPGAMSGYPHHREYWILETW